MQVSPVEIQKKALSVDVSYYLIEHRQRLNLTKEEFSEKFDIDISLVEDIENLNYEFTMDTLCEICHKLALDIVIILE